MDGARIAVTSHRMGAELVATLTRRGAQVLHGATLTGDVPAPDADIIADTLSVLDERPGWLVATTGVGMRVWVDVAQRAGLGGQLRAMAADARCVARGAKAVGGLAGLGTTPVWVSPNNTDRDVVRWLAGRVLPGEVVVTQLHGGSSTTYEALRPHGADLLTVVPYRWSLPDDPAPAEAVVRAIVGRQLDLVTFTSAGAVRNLHLIAAGMGTAMADGLRAALAGEVAVACVGPVTAEAVEVEGGVNTVVPRRWRTADLVRDIESWWRRRDVIDLRTGIRLVPDRRAVATCAGEVALGEREYAVLASLSRRPGVVVTGAELLVEAWGHEAPAAAGAVKHQISRLRRKLDGSGVHIATVRGRGYRMDVDA